MHYEFLNTDALERALIVALGPQGAEVVNKLYAAIDAAQQAGYNEGHLEGFFEAEEANADLYNTGRNEGYDAGYEDGYHDGVYDRGEDNNVDPEDLALVEAAFNLDGEAKVNAQVEGADFAAQ